MTCGKIVSRRCVDITVYIETTQHYSWKCLNTAEITSFWVKKPSLLCGSGDYSGEVFQRAEIKGRAMANAWSIHLYGRIIIISFWSWLDILFDVLSYLKFVQLASSVIELSQFIFFFTNKISNFFLLLVLGRGLVNKTIICLPWRRCRGLQRFAFQLNALDMVWCFALCYLVFMWSNQLCSHTCSCPTLSMTALFIVNVFFS